MAGVHIQRGHTAPCRRLLWDTQWVHHYRLQADYLRQSFTFISFSTSTSSSCWSNRASCSAAMSAYHPAQSTGNRLTFLSTTWEWGIPHNCNTEGEKALSTTGVMICGELTSEPPHTNDKLTLTAAKTLAHPVSAHYRQWAGDLRPASQDGGKKMKS